MGLDGGQTYAGLGRGGKLEIGGLENVWVIWPLGYFSRFWREVEVGGGVFLVAWGDSKFRTLSMAGDGSDSKYGTLSGGFERTDSLEMMCFCVVGGFVGIWW